MEFPNELKYTKSHEWVRFTDEKSALIGISDHAQKELGDIVFVNLPEPSDTVTSGESFADVESVKAVSDIYSPVSGQVSKINDALLSNPELINKSAYDAWLIEVENISETEELMSAEEYQELIAKEG